MKKILLFTLTAFMAAGCTDELDADGFNTIVVDSCEYLYKLGPYASMAHKGNCRFCKERRQKELKKLVEQLKKK